MTKTLFIFNLFVCEKWKIVFDEELILKKWTIKEENQTRQHRIKQFKKYIKIKNEEKLYNKNTNKK